MNKKLKPCPFCGAEPEVHIFAGRFDAYHRLHILGKIFCPRCDIKFEMAWQGNKAIRKHVKVDVPLWQETDNFDHMHPVAREAAEIEMRRQLVAQWEQRTALS